MVVKNQKRRGSKHKERAQGFRKNEKGRFRIWLSFIQITKRSVAESVYSVPISLPKSKKLSRAYVVGGGAEVHKYLTQISSTKFDKLTHLRHWSVLIWVKTCRRSSFTLHNYYTFCSLTPTHMQLELLFFL